MASGELVLRFTTGEGWTDEIRRRRVNVENAADIARLTGAASRGTSWSTIARIGRATFRLDPHYIGFFDDVKSEIAMPLQNSGGGTIGVINIESPAADKFDDSHADILEPLCRRRAAIIVAMAAAPTARRSSGGDWPRFELRR